MHTSDANTILEYCNASEIFDNVDVLCLENGNIHIGQLLKTKPHLFFFLKKILG